MRPGTYPVVKVHSPGRFAFLFLIPLLMLYSLSAEGTETPQAVKGVLDLRSLDFNTIGSVKLDGAWCFYYGAFLQAADFDTVRYPCYVSVPRTWLGSEWGSGTLPGKGFATYYLCVLLPAGCGQLAVRIPGASSSYAMYINDSLVAQNGRVGKTRETYFPQFLPLTASIDQVSDTLRMVAWVANFDYWKGGLWYSISLGPENEITRTREWSLFLEYLMCGACLFMFLYLFTLYLFRPVEKPALYFSLFFLMSVLRSLVTGEQFITGIFPSISWEALVKWEFLSFYLLLPLACLYIRSLFPLDFSRLILRTTVIVVAVFSSVTLVTPVRFCSHLVIFMEIYALALLLYVFYVIIRALIRHRENSAIILAGYSVMFLAALNELLYSNNLVNTFNSLPAGFLLLFISQAILLSRKFSREFNQIDKLTKDLAEMNERLENVNISLRSFDEAKTEFLHLISHEVRTPLNGIIGFTSILKEELQSSELSDIIDRMDRSASRLEDFSRVALLITEMQASQAEKNLVPLPVETLLLQFKTEMVQVVNEKEHRITTENKAQGISINGNPELLRIAFQHLFSQFSNPATGTAALHITALRAGAMVAFEIIRMDGGLSPEDFQHLEQYFRNGTPHPDPDSGLSLSLIRLIVNAHGGEIGPHQEPHKPKTLSVRFPVS